MQYDKIDCILKMKMRIGMINIIVEKLYFNRKLNN